MLDEPQDDALLEEDWQMAADRYTECLQIGPPDSQHINFSNRAVCQYELGIFDGALEDAMVLAVQRPHFL